MASGTEIWGLTQEMEAAKRSFANVHAEGEVQAATTKANQA